MRLIDADRFIKDNEVFADCEFEHRKYQATLREVVDDAPTVDAVDRELYEQCKFDKDIAEEQLKKIVRCKNCRYFVTNYAVPHCGRTLIGMKKSDYCSYGERKEE